LFIPYFALITGIELVRALIRSPQRLRVAGAAGLMVLIFSAPIYAWGMRNQRIFGRFLLDSHGGETLMQCIAYRPETKAGIYPEFIKTQPIYQQIKGMNEAEADVFFTDQAKTWIREHPGLYIRNSLANSKDFWRLYPRPDQSYPEGRMKLILISLLTEPIFLAGGLVGLIKTRGDWRRLYPIYIAILLLSVMHALITGQMRYRLPLMPYAILFAAIAAVGLF